MREYKTKITDTKRQSNDVGLHDQDIPLKNSQPCKVCIFDRFDNFTLEHWDLDSLGCPMICFYKQTGSLDDNSATESTLQ